MAIVLAVVIILGFFVFFDGLEHPRSHLMDTIFIFCGIAFIASFFFDFAIMLYDDTQLTIHQRLFMPWGPTSLSEPITHLQSVTQLSPTCLSMEIKRTEVGIMDIRKVHGNEGDIAAFMEWVRARDPKKITQPQFQIDPHIEMTKLIFFILLLAGILGGAVVAMISFLG